MKSMLVAAALLSLSAVGCHPEDFDSMERQPKLTPYGDSDVLGDGRAMRSPPAGVVPRERILGDARPQVTAQLVTLGRNRFDTTCAACHGRLGDGDSVVATKMGLRPPPSLHEPRLRALDAAALYAVVRDGYGLMPSFGHRLDPNERWAVVAYVRALQLSQSIPIARVPPPLREKLDDEEVR